jgi:hypothetical protein
MCRLHVGFNQWHPGMELGTKPLARASATLLKYTNSVA